MKERFWKGAETHWWGLIFYTASLGLMVVTGSQVPVAPLLPFATLILFLLSHGKENLKASWPLLLALLLAPLSLFSLQLGLGAMLLGASTLGEDAQGMEMLGLGGLFLSIATSTATGRVLLLWMPSASKALRFTTEAVLIFSPLLLPILWAYLMPLFRFPPLKSHASG